MKWGPEPLRSVDPDEDGLALRIILPDPESAFFKQFVEDQRKQPGDDPFIKSLKQKHEQSLIKAKQLTQATGKPVHKLANQTICSGIVRFDQVIKISAQTYPYLQGKEATLLIEERPQDPNHKIPNKIYTMYKESFDQLWGNKWPAPDSRPS